MRISRHAVNRFRERVKWDGTVTDMKRRLFSDNNKVVHQPDCIKVFTKDTVFVIIGNEVVTVYAV